MSRPVFFSLVGAVLVLAGCAGGTGTGTITVGPTRAGPPPAPPADALTLARQLRGLGIAVAVSHERSRLGVRVSVLGPQGNGVDGARVRISGAPATPCGHGCYAGTSRVSRSLNVEVGAHSVVFALPRPPFRTGRELLRRVNGRYLQARTAVFHERLSSGPGQTVTSNWRVAAPASLAYTASDGTSGVIIGGRRWDKQGGSRWRESPQIPTIPQLRLPWSHSPTNVMELDPGSIEGRKVMRLSFLDPAVPAWYTLSVTPHTHELVRIDMIAPAHFMQDDYRSFDEPLTILPPRR